MKPFYGKTKPSELLQAMVDGLRRVQGDEQRLVNMDTFGRSESESPQALCYGCAATWALDALLPNRLNVCQVQSLGVALICYVDLARRPDDLVPFVADAVADVVDAEQAERVCKFEFAIDAARRGYLGSLAEFCELGVYDLLPWTGRWVMNTANYLCQLPAVEQAIAEMQYENL